MECQHFDVDFFPSTSGFRCVHQNRAKCKCASNSVEEGGGISGSLDYNYKSSNLFMNISKQKNKNKHREYRNSNTPRCLQAC